MPASQRPFAPRRSRRALTTACSIVLLATACLGRGTQPSEQISKGSASEPNPQAQGLSEHIPDEPDVGTVRADLEFLASDALQGRATDTQGNVKARRFLVDRLETLGADAWLPEGLEQPFTVKRRDNESLTGTNVVAVFKAGRSSTLAPTDNARGAIVLTAHYDHLGQSSGTIYNGADDNASGVVALLEIAKRLTTASTNNDVVIALLDAEELGLQGARALTRELPADLKEHLFLNINLDMIGRSDNGALFVAGTSHTPELRNTMLEVGVQSKITLKLGHDTGGGHDDWTFSSDHAAFHRLGIPFLYFGVEDHDDYHRPSDDSERIDYSFLDQAIEAIWLTVKAADQPGLTATLQELR